MPPVLLLLFFLLQIKPAPLLRLAPFPAAAFVFDFHLFPLGCKRLLGFGTDSGLSQEFGLHLRAIDFAGGGKFKAAPHNSAARLATSFPSSAACKFLDLPPVNLRNLHLHLTKNPFAGRPPHLRGVALKIQIQQIAVVIKGHHAGRTVNGFVGAFNAGFRGENFV